jgi:hypothetical protein
MLRTSIGIAILLMSFTGALAQPAGKAEERVRTLLQNDQVMVREQVWAPGARTAPANYPNSFVYPLTDGTLVITHPGRTPFEMTFRAGEALWLPAQAAITANETGKEIRALVVEIKAPPPGRTKVRAQAVAKSTGKARKLKAKSSPKAAGAPAKSAMKAAAGAKPAAEQK